LSSLENFNCRSPIVGCLALAVAGVVWNGQQAQAAQAAAGEGDDFAIVSRGPHGRTWMNSGGQRVEEIATGLHYWNAQLQEWTPSDPSFVVSADGTAFEATKLLAPVRLSRNLDVVDAVTVTTPDNVTLRSSPIGIGLYDSASGRSLIVASITNVEGVLVDQQDVVFPNAFVGGGFAASVVYSVDSGAFMQDVVFTGFTQHFDPTVWGFAASSTNTLWLQIFTEFYAPPQPQMRTNLIYAETNRAIRASMASPDLVDYSLDFGNYVFGPGKAYTANTNVGPKGGVIVAKDFVSASGRTFLVESVPYSWLSVGLHGLGPVALNTSSHQQPLQAKKTMVAAASLPQLRANKPEAGGKIIRGGNVAAAVAKPRGVVIDYVVTPTSMSTPTVFSSDATYYVSGTVYATGPVVMEGATFKFPSTSGSIEIENTLTMSTTNYRPVTFSAADDNTVGTTLSTSIWSGYTGNPSGKHYGGSPALLTMGNNVALNNVRFCYMNSAIEAGMVAVSNINPSFSISHSELVDCVTGIYLVGMPSNSAGFTANNCLMANVQIPFQIMAIAFSGVAYNCTVDSCADLINNCVYWSSNGTNYTATGSFTFNNCILSSVANNGPLNSLSLGGAHNGFYSSPTFGSFQTVVSSSPYQSVGAGNYYLSSTSPLLTNGTATISPALLSQLAAKTTQPPLILTNAFTANTTLTPQAQRDTAGTASGFHYDPIDYLAACSVSNATLLLTNGVALAYYDNLGVWLQDGSQLVSQGTPNQRNYLVYYGLVQEQPVNLWGVTNAVAQSLPISPWPFGSSANPSIFLRLTTISTPQGETNLLNTADFGVTGQAISGLTLRDCEIYGAGANWLMNESNNVPAIGFTNNVFHRVPIAISNSSPIMSFNNLFYGTTNIITNITINLNGSTTTNAVTNTTTVSIRHRGGTSPNTNEDNVFDGVKVLLDGTVGYNAYLHGATNTIFTNTDITNITFAWVGGPLGAYYQANNSPLLTNGSTYATNLGLYHYTVTTNNVVEGTNIVSRGYHYVALGTNGLPLCTSGDGVADYLADVNGNNSNGTGSWTNYISPNGLTVASGLLVFTPLK
jgi:hypothetical protein